MAKKKVKYTNSMQEHLWITQKSINLQPRGGHIFCPWITQIFMSFSALILLLMSPY